MRDLPKKDVVSDDDVFFFRFLRRAGGPAPFLGRCDNHMKERATNPGMV